MRAAPRRGAARRATSGRGIQAPQAGGFLQWQCTRPLALQEHHHPCGGREAQNGRDSCLGGALRCTKQGVPDTDPLPPPLSVGAVLRKTVRSFERLFLRNLHKTFVRFLLFKFGPRRETPQAIMTDGCVVVGFGIRIPCKKLKLYLNADVFDCFMRFL